MTRQMNQGSISLRALRVALYIGNAGPNNIQYDAVAWSDGTHITKLKAFERVGGLPYRQAHTRAYAQLDRRAPRQISS